MTTLAVDLSNYTTNMPVPGAGTPGGLITDDLVREWKAEGFTHAMIGTQWPEVAKHQLEVCHRNGMTLDLYSWLSWGRSGGQQAYVASRQALGQGYPIRRHWLDVEEKPAQGDTVQQLRDAIAGLGGFPCGIYTGRYVWAELMGATLEFAHLPLWLADYINTVPAASDFKPFSGWQRCAAWQYAGSVQTMGANLDLNAVFDEVAQVLQGGSNPMANLNADGSQRIVSEGNFIVTYNNNIPVARLGSTDGQYPGRQSKLFGSTWLWFRTLDAQGQLVAPYWSDVEGD